MKLILALLVAGALYAQPSQLPPSSTSSGSGVVSSGSGVVAFNPNTATSLTCPGTSGAQFVASTTLTGASTSIATVSCTPVTGTAVTVQVVLLQGATPYALTLPAPWNFCDFTRALANDTMTESATFDGTNVVDTSCTLKNGTGDVVTAASTLASGAIPTGDGTKGLVSSTLTAPVTKMTAGVPSASLAADIGGLIGIANPSDTQVVNYVGVDGVQHRISQSGGGSATDYANIFNGSTTTLADRSTVSWSCGSGSGAQCTTSWTVPAGVNWVRVQMWGGGAAGGGSIAGSRTGGGGSGGGYTEIVCATAPGSVSIAVGLGGVGASGDPSAAASGGNSSFGTCITVTGGIGGWGASGWPGRASGATNNGYYYGGPGAMADWGNNYCRATDQGGAEGTFIDEGGCGAGGISSAGGAGDVGGKANGGGGGGAGSGSYNNTTQAAGGVSVLGGGSGGHGGAWTSGGGYIACSAGSIPGGGGGSAGAETAGGSNHTGCNGARGEVRVYFAQ
jgi:hypothetical protein